MPATCMLLVADVERDFRLGRGRYQRGLYDQAIPYLENVRTGTSDSAMLEESLLMLAESYRIGGSYEKGAQRYAQLLNLFPGTEWRNIALLGQGECWVKSSKPADAVPVLERYLEDPGKDRENGLFLLAEAQSASGNMEGAVNSYKLLLRTSPDHELAPNAAYNMALLLREVDRPKEAFMVLDVLDMKAVPGQIQNQLYLLRGDLALSSGDPRRALREYQEVEDPALAPDALAGTCFAARELDDRDSFDKARDQLRRRYGDHSQAASVDLLLGSWEAEQGHVESTDAVLERHRSGNRRGEAEFWRGWARVQAGQHAEAARVFSSIAGENGEWGRRSAYRWEGELRRAGEWRAALSAAESFLGRYPQDSQAPEILAGAVESAYRLEENAQLLALHKMFVSNYPDHELSRNVLRFAAEAALRGEEYETAITHFQALLEDKEASLEERPQLSLRLAWAHYRRNPAESGDAIESLLPGLDGAEAAEVGILLGRSRRAAGRLGEALQAFRRAASADRDGDAGARAALEEALHLSSVRDKQAAAQADEAYRGILRRTEAGSEIRARALFELAELQARSGDFQEAATFFEQYLSENPQGQWHASAGLGLCFCRWRSGDPESAREALDELNRSKLKGEQAEEALYLRGRIIADAGETAQAIEWLNRYLQQYPGGTREREVLRELARLEESRDNPSGAIRHLQALVSSHPNSEGVDEAVYRMAWLRHDSGQAQEAEEAYLLLLKRHPESSLAGDAHYRVADFFYERSEYQEARKHYQGALSSADGERLGEKALYRIGWSHIREESWQEADAAFTSLAERFPEGELSGEALFLAADAAGQIPNPGRERELLKQFLKLHPRHALTAEGKIRLGELL
ncbi:MAG: tetratricopeptide repeat protein, partial [Planctomycetota bacterium]